MRTKLLLCCTFLILFVSPGIAGNLSRIYEFRSPSVEKVGAYSVISFEGTHLLGEPGKATLPFYPVKLLLPPGEVAMSIELTYEDPVTVPGEFELLPRQDIQPISKGDNGKWLMDEKFYRSSDTYPSTFKPQVTTHFYNGCGIALSAYTPVRYIPSEKKVLYYQKVTVTVQTAPDPASQAHLKNFFPSGTKAGHLAGLVQNPEQVPGYSNRSNRSIDYDFLIITTNQYLPEFDTLAFFYKPRGIRTKIVSTEFISTDTTGADLQEKIRNYIIGQYQACGIEYVLIGGDAEIVPYRGFYCHVHSDVIYTDNGIPADLYYSALDGNWNTDGDNLWGEPGEDDLYPEVGVGRLTFKNTTELHSMLHKTMQYQASPVEGELTKPLLAGEYLYNPPLTYGSDYLRLLVGYRTDHGYTSHGIPPSHPRDTLYDSPSYSWDKYTLMNHINSGRPWVHHVGHSNYDYAMRMNYGDITNANFAQSNGIDHNYTIVYTHGCMCGGFDATYCIAEKMIGIDNFAVAFIGNSRYGWFNQGTTDGPSQHLHREFMDAIYYDSLYHIGMAVLKSKSETAPFVEIDTVPGEFEPGATRWCFYDNNLLGDPMMAVWTQEPYDIEAEFPSLVPIGTTSVSVHLSGPQGSIKNFTCSIYRNDTLFGTASTNSSGNADIPLQEVLAEGPVSLVVSGYNIIPQYYDIHVSDYWLGWTIDWNDPGNWYTGAVPDSSTYIIIPKNPAGTKFPLKNSGIDRHCKAIYIESDAQLYVGPGETFSIYGE